MNHNTKFFEPWSVTVIHDLPHVSFINVNGKNLVEKRLRIRNKTRFFQGLRRAIAGGWNVAARHGETRTAG